MENLKKVVVSIEGIGSQEVSIPLEDAIRLYASTSGRLADALLKAYKVTPQPVIDFKTLESVATPLKEYNPENKEQAGRPVVIFGDINSTPLDEREIDGWKEVKENVSSIKERFEQRAFEAGNKIAEMIKAPVHTNMIVDDREVREVEVVDQSRANYIIKPFTSDLFLVPKLVMAKCPHCGVITCKKVILGQEPEMTCHFCRQEFEIEKVILTESRCPKCQTGVFFYAANGLTEYNCKGCESPVDIVYLKDEKKALSANLIKHGRK